MTSAAALLPLPLRHHPLLPHHHALEHAQHNAFQHALRLVAVLHHPLPQRQYITHPQPYPQLQHVLDPVQVLALQRVL